MPKPPLIAGLATPICELSAAGVRIWRYEKTLGLKTGSAGLHDHSQKEVLIIVPKPFITNWVALSQALTRRATPAVALKTSRGKIVLKTDITGDSDDCISRIVNAISVKSRQTFYADIGWLDSMQLASKFETRPLVDGAETWEQRREIERDADTKARASAKHTRLSTSTLLGLAIAGVVLVTVALIAWPRSVTRSDAPQAAAQKLVGATTGEVSLASHQAKTIGAAEPIDDYKVQRLLETSAIQITSDAFDADIALDGFVQYGFEPIQLGVVSVGGEAELRFQLAKGLASYVARFELAQGHWTLVRFSRG